MRISKVDPHRSIRNGSSRWLAPFQIPVNTLLVEWGGSTLSFHEGTRSEDDDRVRLEELDWQRVLLGVEPSETIASFRGGRGHHVMGVLFPELWPQVSELDEF